MKISFSVKLRGRLKGFHPFRTNTSPSCKEDIPIMERGIKGVRLIKNLYNRRLDSNWAEWYILGNIGLEVSYAGNIFN